MDPQPQSKHALGSHEYIQHCRKFDIDIRLQLVKRKGVRSDLARTANDDQSPSTLNHYIHLQERPIKQTISRQALSLLFDTFHNEVDAFLAAEGDFPLKAERVIQSVMAICNALAAVESQEITAALNQMPPCPSRMQPKIQKVNRLPRETLLSVTLFAVPIPPPGSSSDANKQRRVPEALGWVTTPLFNFRQVLTCGRKLLGLWPATQDNSRARSSAPNFNQPDSVILQIDFPTSAFEVKFTSPTAAEFSPQYEFSSLGEEDQRKLREAMQKKSLYWDSCPAPHPAWPGCSDSSGAGYKRKDQDCSYFNSNAVPLKLSFQNVDPLGENIRVIFKCGDDLRQDMLTLQMIRIMNKIWVQEGLDMRMVIFRCFSTGRGRGMVEMIPNAETLRKIQVEHGVTGSFKDRPLADWLQKHNPKEDEYEKAVENFIYSCAGCCVATYVLGICDRHNDNIMLKTTGHMFHIDFGRFLGHAQMFGNIKRDRAPFVFTSDMAYVINGGDKPSSRFHDFVDLCCQAYNLIRKHTHLFLNLLGLMLSCGIPELSDLEDLKYVYDALRPQDSDADATTYFTRGDLQQRELRLSVLSEEGFWENILLGEVGIRLRDLDLAQEKMGWFALGSRGHGTL
ncbi:phosphatidylinositol 4-phosphate 3-kinase c2 domain-containing subunit beta [Limosa lapponica baueri]|uniref:Phosphatidylinositol 4-phosphate 3-kinase c2 domain-containing subunit beta n=1 Tax=Limosa lapponica baueri TaxID=1758121 RepID=A0A2I0THH5_LIMLA|nr:phosphatidylinositol 4-phosphate 3-kinase c2 domain-containing subunit beta [Limosa lapponica baueri]